MSSLTRGKTFGATETVTADSLHNLVDLGSAYDITNDDIKSTAAIVDTKLAQITTASKVSGTALTGLANTPSGAGAIPVANIDTGTTANKIVKLDSNAKIPAVDGSLLTALNASQLTSGTVATARLGSGTAGATNFLRGDQSWASTFLAAKIGSFTRNSTTASGTQEITGVGFQPKVVIFMVFVSTSYQVSFGFDDGSTYRVMYNNLGGEDWRANSDYSITYLPVATHSYNGKITTMGADGFTVSWTKTNSPTGTLTVMYLALR